MLKPPCSNFRIITAMISDVPKFIILRYSNKCISVGVRWGSSRLGYVHHIRQDHFSVLVFQFLHILEILGNFESMEGFLLQNKRHRRVAVYRKVPRYLDTQKICCNHSKVWTMSLYHRVMSPNDADGMANSVDPEQTAPLGAVWSGSALFAQAYLSENLGSLW